MYNHSPENYICPLCQISKGEVTEKGNQEGSVFWRDEFMTCFIAGKWWRSNPGHVIIIPNKHIENIYDMPEDMGHRIFDFSKKVAIALKELYKCDGVSTRQHNEPAGNQDVYHFHLHVFPRYQGDNLYINHKDTYWPSEEEKKPYADKMKKYFSSN
ncbi:MAG: HIT family protein [Candidatus Pacebacteria bacterium]|nr:HIT family protein [Candidatus Paceibacterota bacterium]